MPQLDIADAKYCLSELIEKAIAGEEVMITRDNQPVVKLVPILPLRRRQAGSAKGLIWISDDFDEPLELVPSSQVKLACDLATGIEEVVPETDDKLLVD